MLKVCFCLGSIIAWVPRTKNGQPDEALPEGWIRCNGSVIPEPSIWAGTNTPDLNGPRKFLRGGPDASALTMQDHMVQGKFWTILQNLAATFCLKIN